MTVAASTLVRTTAQSTLARYLLVGAVKVVIDFGVFNLALLDAAEPGLGRIIGANTAGFLVAGGATYLLHARYTFRVPTTRGAFAGYLLVSLAGLVLYNAVLTALVALTDPNDVVALNAVKLVALAASVGWNLFGAWRLVFRAPRGACPAAASVRGEIEGEAR